ncbi:hypothetical protein KO507_00030 [Gilvimarinus agarilyticus]|uniref:DUF1302 family protein n=1 Tax=Gilvimarinus sp. 2_MG-2023 TaxID=3062666 RepID=UPI001C081798|nr:DUF1302 family protein [Gilvimarinus sp. 2_MG-2023]MBU2884142.1 hypothetical protein [Gilvimarinus agarilyticus]MDO6569314.1 hypothetical protein [Gilvimarinus sp. 2_MG-2023]
MNKAPASLTVATLSLLSSLAWPQDFFDSVATQTSTDELDLDSPWTHRTWLQQKTGYGWHTPGVAASRDQAALTRTESQLFGEVGWRQNTWRLQASGSLLHDWLPDLENWGAFSGYDFTEQQNQQRRWRLQLADTFVEWQDNDWWVKAGYQTLAWGESESLKITDVLARRDQRWPGQADLEKLRLPVPAVQVTWNNQLDWVTLIHPLPDRMPAAGDEFDPYVELRQQQSELNLIQEHETRPGFAIRWRQQWQGLDAQWMLADVTSYESELTVFNTGPLGADVHLSPWRQQVLGGSAQWVKGSWLLRTEQALHNNVRVTQQNPQAPWQKTRQWRGMLGADFNGISDLLISAEYSWLYIKNRIPTLGEQRYQPAASGRIQYTLYNDRLTLEAYAQSITGDEGSLIRLQADWTVSDNFSVSLSAIEYDAQQADLLHPYRHNDSLLLSMRWGL